MGFRTTSTIGIAILLLSLVQGCDVYKKPLEILQPLEPRDFLSPPKILDNRQEFGLLATITVSVPATSNIYFAKAEPGTAVKNTVEDTVDTVENNAPVEALQDVIEGGETLDIFATGEARHVNVPSLKINPNGGNMKIKAGPMFDLKEIRGPICALVGMFDNDNRPFLIGQRKQIRVPRGAKKLYLAVLDFPGFSSDNQGEYTVSIDVIRR